MIAAIAIGAAFSAQPAINGAAAKILGSPVAAACLSIAITLLSALVLLPVLGGRAPFAAVTALPWWVVLGGLIGVLIVAGGAAIAPVTGVSVFFVCLIAGQLIGSLALDHLGAFGLAVRSISPVKVLGAGLALLGAWMVRLG